MNRYIRIAVSLLLLVAAVMIYRIAAVKNIELIGAFGLCMQLLMLVLCWVEPKMNNTHRFLFLATCLTLAVFTARKVYEIERPRSIQFSDSVLESLKKIDNMYDQPSASGVSEDSGK